MEKSQNVGTKSAFALFTNIYLNWKQKCKQQNNYCESSC